MSTKREILCLLSETADLDVSTVAQHVRITAQAAGMALLRLTRQGLVRRMRDPDDRVLYYSLTAKGRARWLYWQARPHGTRS